MENGYRQGYDTAMTRMDFAENNNPKNKALEVILYETDRAIFDFDTKRRKLVLPIVVDCPRQVLLNMLM